MGIASSTVANGTAVHQEPGVLPLPDFTMPHAGWLRLVCLHRRCFQDAALLLEPARKGGATAYVFTYATQSPFCFRFLTLGAQQTPMAILENSRPPSPPPRGLGRTTSLRRPWPICRTTKWQNIDDLFAVPRMVSLMAGKFVSDSLAWPFRAFVETAWRAYRGADSGARCGSRCVAFPTQGDGCGALIASIAWELYKQTFVRERQPVQGWHPTRPWKRPAKTSRSLSRRRMPWRLVCATPRGKAAKGRSRWRRG